MAERRASGSKSSLFLIELIFVILFFSLSGAVCVRLFAQARITGDRSRALGEASVRAQEAAELYKYSGGDLGQVGTALGVPLDGETLAVEFDRDWQPAAGNGAYRMEIRNLDGPFPRAEILVKNLAQNEDVYRIQVSKYVPEG